MAANVSFDMLDDAKRANWSHTQWYRSARMQQSCPPGTIWRAAGGTFAQNVPNATHGLSLATGQAGEGAT